MPVLRSIKNIYQLGKMTDIEVIELTEGLIKGRINLRAFINLLDDITENEDHLQLFELIEYLYCFVPVSNRWIRHLEFIDT